MKLKAHEVGPYTRKPDPRDAGLLLFGADPMRVADARAAYARAIAGPDAETDMRLIRLDAGDLRKDPARLIDEIKARGFFDGPRVVIVEEATDTLAAVIAPALDAAEEGDAKLMVTAGALTARSKLRKLFEAAGNARAGGIYDAPPSRDEVAAKLKAERLTDLPRDTEAALMALAQMLEPGDFRQTVEKLSLYIRGQATPVSPEDVAACAPRSNEADLDDLLDVICEGRAGEIAPLLHRLYAQGMQPVRICLMTLSHFRMMHRAASDSGGVSAGVGRLRPPVFGPRRDKLIRQTGNWGTDRLESALRQLVDADLMLRSSHPAPDAALMERVLVRLAYLPRNAR